MNKHPLTIEQIKRQLNNFNTTSKCNNCANYFCLIKSKHSQTIQIFPRFFINNICFFQTMNNCNNMCQLMCQININWNIFNLSFTEGNNNCGSRFANRKLFACIQQFIGHLILMLNEMMQNDNNTKYSSLTCLSILTDAQFAS